MDITEEEIARRLTNAAPRYPSTHEALDALTAAGIAYGETVAAVVPTGREKSLAVTSLEESLAWAKKGVALNQDQLPAGGAPE